MKKVPHRLLLLLLIPSLLTVSCRHAGSGSAKTGKEIPLLRFEQVMFDTPAQQLQQRLTRDSSLYACPLLNIEPHNQQYLAQVQGMACDTTMREIYNATRQQYGDLAWLQEEVSAAVEKAQRLDDSISCNKIITFVSGLLDYTHRVVADDGVILIALDQYTVPSFEKYGYFQLPGYLVTLCRRQYMVPDAVAALARANIVLPDGDISLLDYMIAEGKVQYVLDNVLPHTPDTLKLRYNESQLEWARQNEDKVWAYWIQNGLLFEKDYNSIFNFIEDAPKTNAFGDSAPRMTDFIGRQIVAQYMKKSGSTLHELLQNPDSRAILRVSGWKPKR